MNEITLIRNNHSEAVPHDLSVTAERSSRRTSTRERGICFFVVSGSGEVRYKGKSGANTVPTDDGDLPRPSMFMP